MGDPCFSTNGSGLLAGPRGLGRFEDRIAQVREALRAGERVVFVTLDPHPDEVRDGD